MLMKRKALALIGALLFSVLAGTWFVGFTTANPFDLPVDTGIRIYSTNHISYQVKPYENSTVTLNIEVILVYGYYDQSWAESVHLDSICYSLDGQPLVDISNFEVENYTNYGRDKQDFLRCTATVKLVNLSDGSHTVTAYASDTHNAYAYINDLSASYNFTINSHYQGKVATPTPSPAATPQPTLSIAPNFSFYRGLASMILFVAVLGVGLLVYFRKRKR